MKISENSPISSEVPADDAVYVGAVSNVKLDTQRHMQVKQEATGMTEAAVSPLRTDGLG